MELAKMIEASIHGPTFWILAIFLIGGLLAHFYIVQKIARLRQCGLYPAAGKSSMADVIRLKNAGYTAFAMRCYREIHACSLREAKDAVAKLNVASS